MSASSSPVGANRPRRLNLAAVILAVIAVTSALITLLGLAPIPAASDSVNTILAEASSLLIQIVTVVGALALLLGVMNLLAVQVGKLSHGVNGIYSFITLLAAVLVVAIHIADRAGLLKTLEPPNSTGDFVSLTVMDAVQVAIESALAGLLTF